MRRNRRLIQSVLLLFLAVLLLYRISGRGSSGPACTFEDRLAPEELIYVAHARCRMECRDIDRRLVEKVYREGSLNCDKSSQKGNRPRYALEKRDERGDKIRIIVEDDDGKHVIVTVIRLGKSDKCTCS